MTVFAGSGRWLSEGSALKEQEDLALSLKRIKKEEEEEEEKKKKKKNEEEKVATPRPTPTGSDTPHLDEFGRREQAQQHRPGPRLGQR